MHPRPRAAALLLALGLTLAACEDPPVDEVPDDEATDVEADETADVAVGVTDTEIGEVLVDADGRTLYVFDSDEQGASTCYDDCADDWPALIGEHPVAAEGADEGLVGTATREDGSDQVTYDDWPLYHWAGDEDRGDVDGHGVGGVWWTIDASGEPQRDTEEDETAGAGGGDGGY